MYNDSCFFMGFVRLDLRIFILVSCEVARTNENPKASLLLRIHNRY